MGNSSFEQVAAAEKQAWNKIRSIGSGITFGTGVSQVLVLKEFSLFEKGIGIYTKKPRNVGIFIRMDTVDPPLCPSHLCLAGCC